jgi:hypothetical protein
MKQIIIYIMLTFITIVKSEAQIGINYSPAKGDDIKSPLVIKKRLLKQLRFKSTNSTPRDGQVLISDADGNVRYGDLNATKIDFINGNFGNGLNISNVYGQHLAVNDTDAYITLPPGVWAVNFSLKLKILKSRVTIDQKYQYTVDYRTKDRLTSTQFYNNTFTTSNNVSMKYNATTFLNIYTSNCTGTGTSQRCYYYFQRQEGLISNEILSPWETMAREEAIWARVILSDTKNIRYPNSYNNESTQDRAIPGLYLASGSITGLAEYTTIKGEIYINNKGRTNKSYYLKIALENIDLLPNSQARYKLEDFAKGPEINGIDRFFAVPAND